MLTATIENQRAQVAPDQSASPARTSTMPQISVSQPQVVTLKTTI